MSKPNGPKKPPISKNQIQIQLNNKESFFTSSPLFSSPYPSRKNKNKDIKMEEITKQLPIKRAHLQSSLGKKNQNQKKAKSRFNIPSILSFKSIKQTLYKALKSLN